MDSSEPSLVPQWLRSGAANSSKGGQQIRGEGAWLRSRNDRPLSEYTTGKATSRYEFSGRGGSSGSAETGPTPRRPQDRPSRGHRYGFRESRAGSFSVRGDLSDDREPPVPGSGQAQVPSRNEALGPLTRSLSGNLEQEVQDSSERGRGVGRGRVSAHHRSTTATDFGREGRFEQDGLRNKSAGGCRADGPDSDIHPEKIAGQAYRTGQAAARRRKDPTSTAAGTFDKDFPSLLNIESSLNSPSGKSSAWLGQPGVNPVQRTSRLADSPSGRYGQEREGELRPLSGSQSARMADAMQNNSLEVAQQAVADKQRLEMKQSRMMIPVVPVQSKTKCGHKAAGPRRSEKDRDAKLYNSMMSTAMVADDMQKDGTVVLGRRTGVLPKMNISLVEAPPSLNGIVTDSQLGELALGEFNQHHQKSLSAGRNDFAVARQRQRMQERERNRNSFYDMLKKKSSAPGRIHSAPVKRAASAPTGRMKAIVAQSLNPAVLQGQTAQTGGNYSAKETDEASSQDSGTPHLIQTGNCISAEDALDNVHIQVPRAEEKVRDQIDDVCPCAPPSAEEERLLREMGWHSDNDDEDFCLTEEEIAAFRAQQRKKQRARSSVLSPIQCYPSNTSTAKLYTPSGFPFNGRVGNLTAHSSEAEVQ